MKLYFPGAEGPYKSIISGTPVFYDDKKISNNELALLLKFNNNLFKDSIYISDLSSIETDVNLTWYAADEGLIDFFNELNSKKLKIIFNGKTLTSEFLKKIYNTSKIIRNKPQFYNMIKEWGFSSYLTSHEILAFNNINEFYSSKKFDFPIIVKSSFGKGGKGNLVCYDDNDFKNCISILNSDFFSQKQEYKESVKESKLIVEPFILGCRSFNATFFCKNDLQENDILISEQDIEEVFYRGNKYFPAEDLKIRNTMSDVSLLLADKLISNLGYYGWLGIDFLITPNDEIRILEINPRVNSVTNGYLVSKGLPFQIKLCKLKDTTVSSSNIDELVMYDGSTGILPYQISSNLEFLLISIGQNRSVIEKNYTDLFQKGLVMEVTQRSIENSSKSISYYLENLNK